MHSPVLTGPESGSVAHGSVLIRVPGQTACRSRPLHCPSDLARITFISRIAKLSSPPVFIPIGERNALIPNSLASCAPGAVPAQLARVGTAAGANRRARLQTRPPHHLPAPLKPSPQKPVSRCPPPRGKAPPKWAGPRGEGGPDPRGAGVTPARPGSD